jgi:hypothetical protein
MVQPTCGTGSCVPVPRGSCLGWGGGLAHAGEGGEEVRVCVDINMTDLIFCINLKH